MKRLIFNKLRNWKQNPSRKPLILMGARQVGKTYILKKFAETEYENFVYLNFEDNPALRALFDNSLDPHELIRAISIVFEVDIKPTETLIIFDEVQECPNALNSLKYFCEKASDIHVCAAGSLLDVKLNNVKGFPVGKVNFLNLYPLSFSEFLEALEEVKLNEYLQSIKQIAPIPALLHDKLLSRFKEYLFVGGMPEAVAEFASSQHFGKTRLIQKEILKAYSLDFAKHAPQEQIMRISQVWDSIDTQLGKENKKFIYSIIRKGARAKEFEIALQWLVEAGMIHKVDNLTVPKIPLKAYSQFDYFKIYLLDVGLLGAMANLSEKAIIHGDQMFQEFRGSLSENFVAQAFAHNELNYFYWTSEGKAELDFVFQYEDMIFPVEVKSGISNKKKSLRTYAEKYQPSLQIRISPLNLKKDGNILNCPVYLAENIKQILQLSC